MSKLPNYTLEDANEFIIPDEPVESSPSYRSSGLDEISVALDHGHANNLLSGFIPKVDLSLTFSAFTTSSSTSVRVKELQYTGGDTLDEPVWHTLKRDGLQIIRRLFIVVWPMQLNKLAIANQKRLFNFAQVNGLRLPRNYSNVVDVDDVTESNVGLSNEEVKIGTLDWDLWGPLIFSLVFLVCLGLSASDTNTVFSGSFAFIWFFYIVIGLNIQLLGGTISFLSAISAAGYSMFPIVMGEICCSIVLKLKFFRIILMFVLNLWSIYVGSLSLKCSGVLPGRVLLAMYPLALMYCALSWFVVIT